MRVISHVLPKVDTNKIIFKHNVRKMLQGNEGNQWKAKKKIFDTL